MIGGGIFVGEDGKEEAVFSAAFESGCQGSFQKVARHMGVKDEEPEDNPSDIEYQYDEDEDEEEQEMVIMFKPDPAFLNLIIDKDDDETVH